MISFEDVSFTYTNESYVLEDLSVEIPQGQFVCVLGANGSGKSTFSKLINALLLPDKGEVKVDGLITSDAQNTFAIRSKAGSVFQNPDDQIVASLVENDVAFGPENLGIPNPELRERVEAALAAAKSNVLRSRASWPWNRRSSSSMKPRPCSIRAADAGSCAFAKSCTHKA